MCAKYGASKVTIANRTVEKAVAIADMVAKAYGIDTEACAISEAEKHHTYQVVFQTTPLGMYPKVGDSPISSHEFLGSADVAVDLIYNPEETRFLNAAKQAGCQTINGMEMLFFQAVKAFELWNELTVPEEVQDRCLTAFVEAVKEKG